MTKVAKRKRISRRVKPTVWQTLNQPVVEIHEDFAKNVFFVALILVMIAWLLPYWAGVYSVSAAVGCEKVAGTSVEQGSPLIYESFGFAQDRPMNLPVRQAGRQATGSSDAVAGTVPTWYYVVTAIPGDVADAFAVAANDVLDISEPVGELTEFYEPGVEAVWDAWTDLLMDPYGY